MTERKAPAAPDEAAPDQAASDEAAPDNAAANETAAEPASPVCYAGEMDAAYGGFLTDAELVALLAELRETARVGDRAAIAAKLARALPRVRDDRIHAALKAMLDAREARLAAWDALIATLA
ncbi:MAG TPA: hypothetical protein VMF53_13260 [Alphaproteobacteria bacterium]|nr:hypothetical protein [Alphaproteobacteria bacterium]